ERGLVPAGHEGLQQLPVRPRRLLGRPHDPAQVLEDGVDAKSGHSRASLASCLAVIYWLDRADFIPFLFWTTRQGRGGMPLPFIKRWRITSDHKGKRTIGVQADEIRTDPGTCPV